MEEEDERDEAEDRRRQHHQGEKKDSFVIKIPSYQEVLDTSQSKTAPPPSLFTPSPSFSQAFNFIKNSDFYSPPPSSSTTSQPSHTSSASASASSSSSRPLDQSEVPPSSSSAAASSSSSSSLASHNTHNRNSILVSHRQKGNPLLKHIRNVRWAFADVVCDYLLGQSTCALYLRSSFNPSLSNLLIKFTLSSSLRYHLLHPDYLYYRIRELQKNFQLRVVLCHVDVEDVVKPLLDVTKTALLHDCTLLCGWSLEECGRYLETIKVYENKPADIIQGQMDADYLSRLTHALTTVRHVNKTDVVTLGSTFRSLSHIMDASMEDLARCPGIGERKVKRLYDAFHEPFKRAVPKHLSIPETSTQNNVEPCQVNEENAVEKEMDASKRRKKEPEITIKSALSAAFAKYSGKKDKSNGSLQDKTEESSSATLGSENQLAENRDCQQSIGQTR